MSVSLWDMVWGAALTTLVFGAIVWGATSRRLHGWKHFGAAAGVPMAWAIFVMTIKPDLTFVDRLVGIALTASFCGLAALLMRGRIDRETLTHG